MEALVALEPEHKQGNYFVDIEAQCDDFKIDHEHACVDALEAVREADFNNLLQRQSTKLTKRNELNKRITFYEEGLKGQREAGDGLTDGGADPTEVKSGLGRLNKKKKNKVSVAHANRTHGEPNKKCAELGEELAAAKTAHDKLEAAHRALQDELDKRRNQSDKRVGKLMEERDRNKQLAQELAEAREEPDAAGARNDKLKQSNSDLQDELDKVKVLLAEHDKESGDAKEAIAQLEQELVDEEEEMKGIQDTLYTTILIIFCVCPYGIL